MTVEELARRFRAALLRREAAAQSAVLAAYEAVWQRLEAELLRVAAAVAEGGVSALFERERLRRLQDHLAEAILELAAEAALFTQIEQNAVIELATRHAPELLQAAAHGARATFARLPVDALKHLVGVAQDGSPVSEVFAQVGREMGLASAEPLKQALIEGVALGEHPHKMAARVRAAVDAKGDNPQRDPAVVRRLNLNYREQVLGAYREATRLNYEANARVLAGWRWLATRDPRTCVICWAMDGTVFPADAPMVKHIACRCVMAPLVNGADAGETGPEAFAKLAPGFQQQILGASGYEAYARGDLELHDLIATRHHERWGDSLYRRGLEDVLRGKPTAGNLTEFLRQPATKLPSQIDLATLAETIAQRHETDGGSTHSPYFGNLAGQKLFAVSLYNERGAIAPGRVVDARMMEKFIRANEDLLADPRHAVGTWHNPDDGLTYIDVIALLPDKKTAVRLGRQFDQIAIFDLARQETIDTGGTGALETMHGPARNRLPRLRRKK